MDEKVFDVTMIYIDTRLAANYSLEFYCRNKNIKLNFSNVEGIELIAKIPLTEKLIRANGRKPAQGLEHEAGISHEFQDQL